MPAVMDVAEFLRRHPPFDTLPEPELDAIAAQTEIEFHPAGQTVLSQGATPVDSVWVVRTGSVELSYDGQVLDLIGEGELFGQASMMSGLPAGFTARTAEDSLVYRLPAESLQAPLARPRALRFLVRSVISDPIAGAGERPPVLDPLQRRVGSLVRMPLVACAPSDPVRDVARRMTDRNTSAVLVLAGAITGDEEDLGGRARLGIVTDTDLRSKVIAAGLDPHTPVSAIMSAPVHTISADRLGGDALLEMLDLGVQHLPVLAGSGRLLGVLEDHDLVSVETRTPFVLRREIARATTEADVIAAAARLRPAVVALRRSGARAAQICALWSVVVDALTRRLLDLAVARLDEPPLPFTWLALGSLARREGMPSSDVDSALAWADEASRPSALATIAGEVSAGLASCGLRPDSNRASAADPLFARPFSSWQRAAHGLLDDPGQPKAMLLTSVLLDSRPVWGTDPHSFAELFAEPSDQRELLLRMLARDSLVHRPPTGFLRDFVVESGGERRGLLDLKRGGLRPIVDLARWAGLAAGVTATSTAERLQGAGSAGIIDDHDTAILLEAFEVITEVRMDHQVEQLERGEVPDDFIKPGWLSSIGRAQLKEAFRSLASVQRGVLNELELGVR